MTLTTHRHREVAEGPAPGEALQIGRYVVLGRLGEGAMGVVYRAYDELLDRKVALKLLQHTGRRDGPARVRLQREAQALAQLSHPNVVQIYDVGEWNGEDFVALEFVRGQTLTTWLIERPRPWQAIVEVFVQAGRGLAAAHAADLVHRDFKPDSGISSQVPENTSISRLRCEYVPNLYQAGRPVKSLHENFAHSQHARASS